MLRPDPPVTVPRPNPLLWLWYAYGGRLPDRYRAWVRRDTTGRSWFRRTVVRTLAQALPVAALAFGVLRLLTSVSAWQILVALAGGLALVLFYAMGMARELNAVRLTKHGFGPDVRPPEPR